MSKSKKNKNIENFGEEPFSETLNKWLKSEHVNNVASLNDVFGEKTFAITFLLLMSFPALPIPTGGLSHVFEVIVMLLSLQLIIGRKVLWLPNKWKNKHLGKNMEEKAIPILIKYITKLEKISKPRMSRFLDGKVGTSLFGIIIFSFTLVALLAPPFSGLDTLPSIGVIVIALGIILGDILFVIVGMIIGTSGVAVTYFIGEIVINFIKGLF